MTDQSILWRRLDVPGHESARVVFRDSCWHLTGAAVFAHDQQPCRMNYSITCDSVWQTLSATVAGWVGNQAVEIEILVDSARRWRLNGKECAGVAGCTDVDLNFSPSTNLLPIRRLNLDIAQEAEVRAAWLRFPGFNLELLEQTYRRTDKTTYRYQSAGGRFTADLQVNESGFVIDYPNIWQEEVY
ncbi:MAG: putative glycolipid-binding domain-containing protein [Blastocatellia bacterium]